MCQATSASSPACASAPTATASSWCSTRCRPDGAAPGKFWGLDHFGVRPDILITAKGIASGFPLSGDRGAVRI